MSKWIDVNKKLPKENGEWYWVFEAKYNLVLLAEYYKYPSGIYFWKEVGVEEGCEEYYENVTHWKHILMPNPPQVTPKGN